MSRYEDVLAQASPQQLAIAQRRLGTPQADTSAGGAKGFMVSQLPSLLAAGASLIPGVGTAAAAGLGGIGEAGRQLLSGEDLNIGNIGKEAALSAIPGGAGKLLKLAGRGAKVAKGAEEVAQVAGSAGKPTNVLERFAGRQAGKARGIKPGAKTAGMEQLGVQDANELNTFLDSQGIKGKSARDQLAALEELQTTRGKQIGDIVSKSNRPLTAEEMTGLQGRIDAETGKIAGASKTGSTTALLGPQGESLVNVGGGKLDHEYAKSLSRDVAEVKDIEGLNNLRKRLDADAINYGRGSNSPDPMREQIAKAYRRSLDETVSGAIPELKGVQQLYGKGASASEYLKDAAKNPQGIGFRGLPIVPGETLQGAQASLGSGVSGASSKLADLMRKVAPLGKLTGSFAGQEVGRSAVDMLAPGASGAADTATPPTDNSAPSDGSQTGLDGTATDMGGAMGLDPSDPAVLQGLYKQALAAPDAKTQGQLLDLVSKIIDIQGKISPSGSKKPLSTAAATQVANSRSGLRAIDQLQGLLDKSPGLAGKNALGGLLGNLGQKATGTQDFEAAKNEIIDVISRTRSGAALTPKEIENYKKDLPRLGDSKKVINQKLDRFRLLFNDQLSGLQQGSPDLEVAGVGIQ